VLDLAKKLKENSKFSPTLFLDHSLSEAPYITGIARESEPHVHDAAECVRVETPPLPREVAAVQQEIDQQQRGAPEGARRRTLPAEEDELIRRAGAGQMLAPRSAPCRLKNVTTKWQLIRSAKKGYLLYDEVNEMSSDSSSEDLGDLYLRQRRHRGLTRPTAATRTSIATARGRARARPTRCPRQDQRPRPHVLREMGTNAAHPRGRGWRLPNASSAASSR
jgi:hypothetical protein